MTMSGSNSTRQLVRAPCLSPTTLKSRSEMLCSSSFQPSVQSLLKEVRRSRGRTGFSPRTLLTRAGTDLIGAVESVKAASDIVSRLSIRVRHVRLHSRLSTQYAPVSGKVLEVNQRLNDEPGLLNKAPEDEGVQLSHNPLYTLLIYELRLVVQDSRDET